MAGKLVNRTKLGDAVDNKLYENLVTLNKITKIPRSKLLDRALELLSKEYEKELNSIKNETP